MVLENKMTPPIQLFEPHGCLQSWGNRILEAVFLYFANRVEAKVRLESSVQPHALHHEGHNMALVRPPQRSSIRHGEEAPCHKVPYEIPVE